MSVVANVVCRYGSWVAYDGRAEKDGVIINENTPKAKKINNFVCVGYTGILELAEAVITHLISSINPQTLEQMKSNHMAQTISQILVKSSYPKDWYAQFICPGVNSEEKMASFAIDIAGKISELIPSDQEPFCFCVLSTGKYKPELENYVLSQIETNGSSNVAIVKGMKQYIHGVSLVDDSVNDNVKVIELRT